MNLRLPPPFAPRRAGSSGWSAYLLAALVVLAIAAIGMPLLGHLDLANIAMLFPLAVLFAAVRLGRGPAVVAAFLSVVVLDFFFVPPHLTLAVSDLQYLLTFAVLLLVALIAAHLATGLTRERDDARQRELRTQSIYELTRALSASLTAPQIAEITRHYVHTAFGADARLESDDEGPDTRSPHRPDANPADDRDGDDARTFVLHAPMRDRGTLVITPAAAIPDTPDATALMETIASLTAISLERVHYVEVAQAAEVDMASERLRNTLLGALSHDLRTPLTALVGLAETLSLTEPPLTAEQAELSQAIRDEALRTATQVSKLLDMARLQSGKVQLRCEWQPLEEVVGAALQAMHRALARHTLELDLPADLPIVNIDAALIERVLCNLFENAAKYAPPATRISISARVRAPWLELSVADCGPGLPIGREDEIFEKFVRGRNEDAAAGVGLGLAIVRAIVTAHEGRVWAENQPFGGARFVVALPLGTPPLPPQDYA